MNKISISIKWIMHNSYPIALGVLMIYYMRWLRLTPLVFSISDDPTFAFVGGMIILIPSGLFVGDLWLANKRVNADTTMFITSLVFFGINMWYLDVHIPRIITTTKCDGVTYYSTYGSPLTDEQWTYTHLSKWNGLFSYESSFNGYAPGSWANKIVCDEEKKEANIIDHYPVPGFLEETHGEELRYYEHAVAQLKDHLYFISYLWPKYIYEGQPITCRYTLYQCKLDYTSCNPLPIEFLDEYEGYSEYFYLESDEVTNTVILYKNYDEEDQKQILLYGEESVCFVDRCSIINE